MIEINLHKAKDFDIKIAFPSEWNDLTSEEILCVARRQLQDGITLIQQKALIFQDILKIRSQVINSLQKGFIELIDIEQAATAALDYTKFLYEDNRLTLQLFPEIDIAGTVFYGTEENFDNITCGEFEDTEIFFNDFINDPRKEPLAHLAAILYRKKDQEYIFFDARKHVWKPYQHEKYLQRFLELPEELLYAIFIFYSGCRSMLPLWFSAVYDTGNGTTKSEPDLMAFTKCIHAGAGERNGSRETIRRTLLKEFFMDMNLNAIANAST